MGTAFSGVIVATVVATAPVANATSASVYPTFYNNLTPISGGEPSVAVTKAGNYLASVGTSLIRSTDGGHTWTDITPPAESVTTLDQRLVVDHVSGRAFFNQLLVVCSVISYSDNIDGNSVGATDWVVGLPCGKPGEDHEVLAVGPVAPGATVPNLPTYSRALYYTYSDIGTASDGFTRSLDGGDTWVDGTPAAVGTTDRGITGATPSGFTWVDQQNGNVYAEWTKLSTDEHWVSVSSDGGVTWNKVAVGTLPGDGPDLAGGSATDGGLGSDAASHVYSAWMNRDGSIQFSYSTDNGTTWSPQTSIVKNYVKPASGSYDVDGVIRSTAYPTLIAGAKGRVAIAYYGTEDSSAGPDNCFAGGAAGVNCRWREMLTTISDADTPNPTITTYAMTDGLTNADKYVQRAAICTQGNNCLSGSDRNFDDFQSIGVDNQGWPVVAYNDACLASACGPSPPATKVAFGKEMGAFNLFGGSSANTGTPAVKITSPTNGASVSAGSTPVAGFVNRDSTSVNQPPTATLSANPTSGVAPLAVTFALGASDTDGVIASWSFDANGDGTAEAAGSGAPPASESFTYTQAGTFVAKLTVTDDQGATGSASAVVSVTLPQTGVPQPDGTITGTLHLYEQGQTDAFVLANIAGPVVTPTYAAGDSEQPALRQARSLDPSVPVSASSVVKISIYDPSGNVVAGPMSTTGTTENPTTSGCTCYAFNAPLWTIPSSFSGTYYAVAIATVAGTDHVIADLQFDVVGTNASPPPPPSTGGPGPSDAGHTIADPDNDGTTPFGEIQWADVAQTPSRLNVVMQLQQLPPLTVGDSTIVYDAVVNGHIIQSGIVITGPFAWDPSPGAVPGSTTTTWDTTTNRVTINIDRAYLTSIGVDAPYNVHVQSMDGEAGAANGVVVDDRAPNAGEVTIAAAAKPGDLVRQVTIVPTGSSGNPEVTDPPGDSHVPWMDITKMWVDHETPTTFEITMQVADMSQMPPSIVSTTGTTAEVATNFGAQFCLDNNLNSASTGPLFCYLLSAIHGATGDVFSGSIVQQNPSNSCGLTGLVDSGAFNVAANTVTWRLVRAQFDVKANSADLAACKTSPPVRGGHALVDGTTLSSLQGSTGNSVGAAAILTTPTAGDTTDPSIAVPYVFGQTSTPLTVSAGGPYSGNAGAAISIGATVSGGTSPYTCAWSGAGASFASASTCATTVTFTTAGAQSISLAVTDSASHSASSTATVNVAAAGERVEIYVDGATSSAGAVATSTSSASPTASWNLNIDTSALSGQHTLTAKWFDVDNTLLASNSVTVTVAGSSAAKVAIDAPSNDPSGATPLHGSVTVDGRAGHSGITGQQSSTGVGSLLHATILSGSIGTPCAACLAPALQPIGASSAFGAAPGSALDGSDGRWLDVTGLAGRAYRLSAPEGSALDVVFFAKLGDAQSNAAGFNVGPAATKTGIVPDGAAWAFVYARDAPATARLTVFSQFGVPNAPHDLAASVVQHGIVLSWIPSPFTGGSPTTSVNVYRDGSLVASLAPTPSTFVDTGLDSGSSHSYTVTAVNVAGESVRSSALAAIAGGADAPASTATGALPATKVAQSTGTGSVSLAVDGANFATLSVDTTTTDPQTWSTSLDTTTVSDGAHVLSAHYDDGAGGTADASIHFSVGNAASIAITAPANGASTARSFTASGTFAGPGPYTVETRVDDASMTPITDWASATISGASFTSAISGLAPGSFTLEARLLNGTTTVAHAEVGFTAVDAAPTANAGPDVSGSPGATIPLQGSATDPDNDALTYAWTQTSGPLVTISNANGASAFFTAPSVTSDTTLGFRLTVTDPYGASASDDMTATVKPETAVSIDTVDGIAIANGDAGTQKGVLDVAGGSHLASGGNTSNQPPVAAITGFTANGLTIAASGATSIDPDGTIVSYAWDLGDATSASGANVTHTYAAPGSYNITLTVTDNQGAVGQAKFGPFAVTNPLPAAFVANAGDSKFVKLGDPVTLTATTFGATGAVTYQWDTNGDNIADTSGQAISVPTTGMSEGSHTFKVFATDSAGHTAADTVNVLLYTLTSVPHPFDMAVLAGVPDEQAGMSGAVDGNTRTYNVTVPAGSTDISAVLKWNNYVQPVPSSAPTGGMGEDDFDMYVTSPVPAQSTSSAGSTMPEAVDVPSPAAGTWSFEVDPYVAANDHYYLFVNTTQAPVDPVPFLTQTSNTCIASANQLVSVGVSGGSGVTGAWDLDLDGNFNDATGLSATTHFPQDGTAHLVRFRATTADGYRATMFVAVRGATSCGNLPSVVVIGVADTGINPYSKEFAGEFVPYPELRAFTTADPTNLGAKDVIVRSHATTTAAAAGDVLPFTKYPGDYIPNYGINAQPLALTLGGGFYKSLDDAAIWNQGHAVIPLNQWFWFPGTKIIAAIDTSDTAATNSAPDTTPIYDDDGHGTASVSVAAGNTVGSCERCVIAFAEGLSGEGVFYGQPWVDFVSVSAGALGNVGTPDTGTGLLDNVQASKDAAERGQTHSFAAGNGYENAFVTPEQTYTSDWTGPDWNIRVGAVDKTDNTAVLGTGKPVLWSSYGAGAIPAACRNTYLAGCSHSGTSAATPISTGNMANSLLNARIAIGDTLAGQKTSAQASGQSQAVAVGTPIASSPYLSDGVLTRSELWRANFLCASAAGSGIGFPGDGPATPVDYAYIGYGVADAAESNCATQALIGAAAAPAANANADQFFDVDHKIRQDLWGTWAGPTDHPSTLPSALQAAPPTTLADVNTLDAATKTLHDTLARYGLDASGAVTTETYYLHRTACAGASDPIFMDRTPAAAKEAGDGCGGVASNMDQTWTATLVTASSFAAGSAVSAHIEGFTLVPEPNVVITATLSGDSAGTVGAGSATATSVSVAAVTTPCTDWNVQFVTTKDIPAGETLTLHATSNTGSGDIPICYQGGAAASRVALTGASSSGGGGSGQATANIASPAQGADFDPAKGPVVISGTATFPPAAASEKLYLRRDNCNNLNTDTLYLSPVWQSNAGSGCSLTAGASAPALEAAGQPFVEKYPLVASDLPLQLGNGGTVSGTIEIDTQGVDPMQLTISMMSDHGLVGSQAVSAVAVEANGLPAGPTPVPFTFPVASATAGVDLGSLELDVRIDQQGAVHATELNNPPSFVNIPRLQSATSKQVQVSIDDASFATGTLTVTGTDSWSASWPLTGVADGAHTIYARAGVDGSYGALSAVGVTVTTQPTGPTATVQIQATPAGDVPDGASWTTVPRNATSGAWSYSWNTDPLANGAYQFHARLLSDGTEVAHDAFAVQLDNPRAPVFDPIGDRFGTEGQAMSFVVHATDANGDALTYSATGLPAGATFDPATQTFAWTPDFHAAETSGGVYSVTFNVTDGTFVTTSTISITIADFNSAPVLSPIAAQSTDEMQTLHFTAVAKDNEGDTVTFGLVNPPPGATIDPASGVFTWRPTYDQAGNYTLNVSASDGRLTSVENVPVMVINVNSPPTPDPIGPFSTLENQRLTFIVTATDREHDALTYAAANLPAGATFDPSTQTFYWTPDYDAAEQHGGVYTIEFLVSDYQYTATENVTITVGNVDRAPVFAALGTVNGAENSALSFKPTATDPDAGDVVTITAGTLPTGASFVGGTFAWTPDFDAAEKQGGVYTVTFTASDGTLNAQQTVTIVVANTDRPPKVSLAAIDSARVNTSVAFTATASDPDNEVLTFAYTFGDGGVSTLQDPAHTFATGGTYTVTVVATDPEGLNATATHVILIDATPPTTAATVTGTHTPDGWYDESVKVALAATDVGVGVDATKYGIDADPTTAYTAAFGLPSGEASHTVKFFSTDKVGNAEATKSVVVKVDTLPPTASLNLMRPAAVVVTPTNLTANATDAGSGMARVDFAVDGVVVCSDTDGSDGWQCAWNPPATMSGRHAIAIFAYDRLGHKTTDSVNAVVVASPVALPFVPQPSADPAGGIATLGQAACNKAGVCNTPDLTTLSWACSWMNQLVPASVYGLLAEYVPQAPLWERLLGAGETIACGVMLP
ncbi:MAG: PKD domain-containing protein [Thermoplasmatota archaeon]